MIDSAFVSTTIVVTLGW